MQLSSPKYQKIRCIWN